MWHNLIGGVATIAIGGAYLAMAFTIRASALSDSVGPAGFPKLLAWIAIGLGAILCGQAFLALRARPAGVPAPAAPHAPTEGRGSLDGLLRAGGMLAIGIGYLLIVRYLGYIASIALLIVASALYLGTPFSWRVIAIGIAGAVVYYIVFDLILGIPQPTGLLMRLF
jgi:putative tricarboxylic transport membrane protein